MQRTTTPRKPGAGRPAHDPIARGNLRRQLKWESRIPSHQWATYRSAIHGLRDANVKFLLGGGFAQAVFTGRLRNTKDMDFYIAPEERASTVATLTALGFEDYYQCLPYARHWIYRSHKAGVIVDVIWSMANRRAAVDRAWFDRAQQVVLRGERLRIVPLEEFMWCKLYILQRDHCDWTDLFNVMHSCGREVDWPHLIARLGRDLPLLKAMLMTYGWLCPTQARALPGGLWRQLEIPVPSPEPSAVLRQRVHLLDSRGWFAALRKPGEVLEV